MRVAVDIFLRNPTRFESLRDFLLFFAIAVLLAPMLSALEGAWSRYLLGRFAGVAAMVSGDALASLILTPTILYWAIGAWRDIRDTSTRVRFEALVAWSGLLVTSWQAFTSSSTAYPSPVLLYCPVPFLLWIAMRFGLRGTSLALTTIALFTIQASSRGAGPFMDDVLHIQSFLVVVSVPSLLLAVLTAEGRRAQSALKELNDRNRAMLKAIPDLMFLLTKQGDYLDYHAQNPSLLFTTPAKFMNHNIREVLPTPLAHEFLRTFEAVSSTGEMRIVEYVLPIRDGKRCFEARVVPSGSQNVLCVIRDLTTYKEAERALRRTEERYREVVESQTDLVCRYLRDSTLTFVNEACCRFLGRQREELIGRKFLDLIPQASREIVMHDIRLLSHGVPMLEREYEVVLPNRSSVWQHWVTYATPLDDGEAVEFQAIGRDVTDRKRAEEAHQNLAHASRLAVAGELTALIAHEISQPLGAILSNADAAEILLDNGDLPVGDLREILGEIRKDDLRATEAIRRIRKLLRKRPIDMQPVNVNDVSADVLKLVAGDAIRRRILLHKELEPGLPMIRGDRVHLQHVLLNLVLNGMDAVNDNANDERRLTIRTSRIEPDKVEISVTDTGHGIPSDKLPRIFDSFFTTKKEGMGLGLSIARSIVEAHQGRIWAENNPDRGAVFRFDLPVMKTVPEQAVVERP